RRVLFRSVDRPRKVNMGRGHLADGFARRLSSRVLAELQWCRWNDPRSLDLSGVDGLLQRDDWLRSAPGRHECGIARFEKLPHAGRSIVLEPRLRITTWSNMTMGVDVSRNRSQAFAVDRL